MAVMQGVHYTQYSFYLHQANERLLSTFGMVAKSILGLCWSSAFTPECYLCSATPSSHIIRQKTKMPSSISTLAKSKRSHA